MWTQLINFSFCKAYSNCMYFKGIEGMGRGLKEFFFIYWELATIYLQHRLLFLVHLLYKLACMVSFLLWEFFFLWSASIELCDCSSKKKKGLKVCNTCDCINSMLKQLLMHVFDTIGLGPWVYTIKLPGKSITTRK